MRVGYALSSEEHGPLDLVRHARRAEEAGFGVLAVSDHFHPWTDRQGHSPFVWSVLGAIARVTERIEVGTRVTCPTMRIHPAVVAHAAATTAAMMPGRFFLGLGTGENLNEHILGQRWPPPAERLEMLAEAVAIIRALFAGGVVSHSGPHFTVENARLYTRPPQPAPIFIAIAGPKGAEQAGRIGDGLIGVAPDESLLSTARHAGNRTPAYGELHVCWAEDEPTAREIAHRWWPMAAFKGPLGTDLRLPSHFEEVSEMIGAYEVAEAVVCGPDPRRHVHAIRAYLDAGYDKVWVHQIGPDQDGFFDFYEREVLPHFP